MNIFEYASRNKIRFSFKGLISTEELWDLSLENLDSIYKNLNSTVKKLNEDSLLNSKSSEDKLLEVQLEIVKYIFNQKVEEKATKLLEKEKREKKQKIMSIMESKRDQALQNASLEELQHMLDDLL